MCTEGSVHHAMFVHELQTLKDLIGHLQHLLWTNRNKQNALNTFEGHEVVYGRGKINVIK